MKKLFYILFLLITIDLFSHCNPKYSAYAFVNINGYDYHYPIYTHSYSEFKSWVNAMRDDSTPNGLIRKGSQHVRNLLKAIKGKLEQREGEKYEIKVLKDAETRYKKGWFKANFGSEGTTFNYLYRKLQPTLFDSSKSMADRERSVWIDKAGKDLKGARVDAYNFAKELHLFSSIINNREGFLTSKDRYEIYPRSYYMRLKKEEEERIKLEKEELKRKEAEEKRERDFRKYRSADGTKSFVGKIRGINLSTKEFKFEEENTKNIFLIKIDNIYKEDIDYIREWYKKSLRNI